PTSPESSPRSRLRSPEHCESGGQCPPLPLSMKAPLAAEAMHTEFCGRHSPRKYQKFFKGAKSMFGRRSGVDEARLEHPVMVELPRSVQRNLAPLNTKPPAVVAVAPNPHQTRKTDEYYDLKKQLFGA